ncbi:MAG: alkaline phosphatase family protein [Sedimentisphaerales bacterium]|nr:alkaline phosphatase family protein [Sedimentisphaerales bacterium]
MVLLTALAGCGRLKPVPLLDETVNVPERKVIVLFVDGVNRAVFSQMLADGQLPQIDRYLVQRGVRVASAVTAAPSITYAITTTFLTGQVPAHHGILGNRYFDRDRLYFADYTSTKTYRDTDADYRAATIYEILNDRMSISIQTAMRRGVYRKIDNWASSGIRWFFNFLTEIDALTAERFYLIGDIARRSGHWPALIFAYFPATDEIGHRYGPHSRQYRRCLQNVDEQIGRIGGALAASGLLESTYLIFVSDHGMAACARSNYLSLAEALSDEFGELRVTDKGPGREIRWEKRQGYYRRFDVVVSNGGNRRSMIYRRSGPDWSAAASEDQIRPLADFLVGHEAVCLAAYPGPQGVWVQNARGRALIQRRRQPGESLDAGQYLYRVVDGSDPLGYADGPSAGGLLDGRFHSGRTWLAATSETDYPDLVVQAAELFDSRRAGDLMVFAADGWDFARRDVGGHGSVAAVDMQVPMVFAGPGIRRAGTIPAARTVDIAPTIIDLIDPDKLRGQSFDGGSLRQELFGPEPPGALLE